MTIPMINYPAFRPYTNITPFTVRDGATYLLQIETLLAWIRNDLVPHIDKEIRELQESWDETSLELISTWEQMSADLIARVEQAEAAIGDAVTQAEAAQAAAEAARDLAAMYASQAEAIQDQAIAGIAGNADSQTRETLDAIYASVTALSGLADSLETLSNTVDTKASSADLNALGVDIRAEIVESGEATEVKIQEAYDKATLESLASPAALGRFKAAMANRLIEPVRIAFLGSSTTIGTGSYGTRSRMVDTLVKNFQDRYPSGLGYETNVLIATGGKLTLPGVHGYEMGISAAGAAGILGNGNLDGIARLTPSVVVITVGSSDYASGTGVAAYEASIRAAIATVNTTLSVDPVFILVHSWKRYDVVSPAHAWDEYGAALRRVAADIPESVIYVNASRAFDVSGTFTDDPFNLFTADAVHGSNRAHALLAAEISKVIFTDGIESQPNPLTEYDSFTGATNAVLARGETGMVWVSSTVPWTYYNNTATAADNSFNVCDVGSQAVVVASHIHRPSSGIAGIGALYASSNNRLSLYMDTVSGNLVFGKNINSSSTTTIATVPLTGGAGDEQSLRIEILPNGRATAYYNNKLVAVHDLSSSELATLGTSVFMRQSVGGYAAARFNDFTVLSTDVVTYSPAKNGTIKIGLADSFTGTAKLIVSDNVLEFFVDVTTTGNFNAETTLTVAVPTVFRPLDISTAYALYSGGASAHGGIFVATNGTIRTTGAPTGSTRVRGKVVISRPVR